ncbi:MAG: ABC transporter ATP-binding protein/permease [Pelagimonas sp.]|uniref:ABC transporter ATP-binding protein/permease n=1 Tax=Pelagimonas sp. TaxID=2073170 RepID=UPI003D6A7F07
MSHLAKPKNNSSPAAGFGAALSVLASLIWLAQAAVIAKVLAALLSGAAVDVWTVSLAFLGLGALRAIANQQAQATLSRAAEHHIQDLRQEIVATESSTAEVSPFGGAGSMAALATEKLEALRPFLLRYAPARLRVMVVPLFILAISAWHSWAAAIVLVAAGPLIPVFMALVGWAAKEASARQMVEIGSLNDLLADRLSALADLTLIGAGPQVIDRFAAATDTLRHKTMAVLRIAFLSSTVLELFSALGVAMIAVWVGFALLGEISWGTWGAPLTPFGGIYLLLLAPDFFQPLRDLAAAWHDKSAADAVTEDLAAWRGDARRALLGKGALAPAVAFQTLALRDVAVDHPDRTLRLPNMEIRPGDSLAISGPSGVGKTTLLRVLAGLEPPTRGAVLLNDAPITDIQADAWRATLGWMPQTPHFLGRSLRHNIGFGANLDENVLARARVAPVLAALPSQDLTQLGETGAGLSGGEARRVMLARAMHRAPAVLLADEPTADLDAETAKDIIDALMAYVASGGTLITTTHDQRLIDRIPKGIRLEAEA